jgi:hypothetical protein
MGLAYFVTAVSVLFASDLGKISAATCSTCKATSEDDSKIDDSTVLMQTLSKVSLGSMLSQTSLNSSKAARSRSKTKGLPEGEEESKHARTSDEMINEFRQARSIDDKLHVMFQAQVDGQASNERNFQEVDKRMDSIEARLTTLENHRDRTMDAGGAPQHDDGTSVNARSRTRSMKKGKHVRSNNSKEPLSEGNGTNRSLREYMHMHHSKNKTSPSGNETEDSFDQHAQAYHNKSKRSPSGSATTISVAKSTQAPHNVSKILPSGDEAKASSANHTNASMENMSMHQHEGKESPSANGTKGSVVKHPGETDSESKVSPVGNSTTESPGDHSQAQNKSHGMPSGKESEDSMENQTQTSQHKSKVLPSSNRTKPRQEPPQSS